MKRYSLLFTLIMIAIMIVGCSSKVEEKVELTDRQIDILMSEDLPTDWDKLTVRQKESIKAIEEMLQYLEDKYDKTFIYKGYRADDPLFHDEESLLVYAEGDDPDTDCFTVERTEDGFEDNYADVLAYDECQRQYEDAVSEILAGKTYKVFSSVEFIELDPGVPHASVYVILDAAEYEDKESNCTEIEKKLYSIDGVDDIGIYFLKDTEISTMTRANWEDVLEYKNIVEKSFTVRKDYEEK